MSWLAKLKQLKEVSLQEEGEILQKLPSPPIPNLQKLQKEVLVVSVGSLLDTSENLGSGNPPWSAVEIDTFIHRRHKLTEKGLALDDAEAVAETLLFRDREIDNRRLCLECVHLQGDKQQGWRCAKVRYAQGNKNGQPLLAVHPMNRQGMVLPMEYVYQLQRCHGFQEAV